MEKFEAEWSLTELAVEKESQRIRAGIHSLNMLDKAAIDHGMDPLYAERNAVNGEYKSGFADYGNMSIREMAIVKCGAYIMWQKKKVEGICKRLETKDD